MELSETKQRIVRAAEEEFAAQGYAGASIRSITKLAGVNVAAVNYHFGSKEELFKQMARARFEPINELRLSLLDTLEKKHAPNPPPIASIVDIIIRPLVANFLMHGSQGFVFMRAMGKALSEERAFMQELQQEILRTIIARVTALFTRNSSKATPEQLAYCMHFLSCSIVGVMIQHSRLDTIYGDAVDANDPEAMSDQLVRFISGGIASVLQISPETASEK